jgi:hypothetical protein
MTGEMTVVFARINQREIKYKNMGKVPYLTFSLTVGFPGTLPESNQHYAREIKLKKVARTPNLTLGLIIEMTTGFGSYFKDVMSVLTRITDLLQKLFSSFFFSPFHRNSRLLLDVTPTGTFFIGMAHSLSLSAVTIKKALV